MQKWREQLRDRWHGYLDRRDARKSLDRTLRLHEKWVLASISFLHDYDAEAAHRLADNITHRFRQAESEGESLLAHRDVIYMILDEYKRTEWG